jgi:hypothetical protein
VRLRRSDAMGGGGKGNTDPATFCKNGGYA